MVVREMVVPRLIALAVITQLLLLICLSTGTLVAAAAASEPVDDLMDFDFEKSVKSEDAPQGKSEPFDTDFGEFLDIIDSTGFEETIGGGSQIQQKEKHVKQKLARAWSNPNMQRKFAEVLPILKVMTSEQKIALAALVSAQVGAKQGRELNLDQVKVMFGDRKELILPLVLDIANLVRLAADGNDAAPQSRSSLKTLAVRDQYESLPSAEFLRAEPEIQPVAPNLALNDDRLNIDLDDEVEIMETSEDKNENRAFIVTRSAPFYDHLLKIMPSFKPQAPKKLPIIQRRVDVGPHHGPRPQPTVPLNQKPFLVPSTPAMNATPTEATPTIISKDNYSLNASYNEVEDLALTGLNGTYGADDLEAHPTEIDVETDADDDEQLPTAEKLIGGRYRKKPYSRYPSHRKPSGGPYQAGLCEKFTGSVCLRVEDYPMDQIMGSIRRHKYAMGALLAEYRDKADDVEHIDYSADFNSAYHRRREDETGAPSPGAMCPSLIRYARPQKARSASGEWKYIVNTGQHTQTLRLEKCSKPQESCTYLTDNFRSRCIQVYNYHRLLSWDKTRGLHVDIFKVPTCCSCRIDGYKEVFPPLNHYSPTKYHQDDYHSAATNIRNPYSTIHHGQDEDEEEEEESEDDEEEDSVGYQYSNGFKRSPKPNYLTLDSPNLTKFNYHRKKATKNSGIDSYLTPPTSKYDSIPFKRGPSTSSSSAPVAVGPKKRPNRTNNRDQTVAGSRSDTIISPKLPLTTEPVRRPTLANVKIESKADLRHKKEDDSNESEVDLSSSRINYNYHPIIDFFEDEEEVHPPKKEARTAAAGDQVGDWRPMINGLKSL